MKILYSLLLLLFFMIPARAQDEMATEISPVYLQKLVDVAIKNYPRLKMYQERVEAGSYAEKKARLSYFEILSFSYLYSPERLASGINPQFLNGYQFGFFVNIGSLLQKPALIKQAKSEFRALQHDHDAYALNIEADVKRRYYNYVQYLLLLRVKSEALLDVQQMADEMKFKYQKGEVSLEEYNKALVVISDRRLARISAETDVLIAKSSLEELTGQKLEDIR